MNARFKNLVGSKRRSSNNVSPAGGNTQIPQPRPTSLSPSTSSTTSLPSTAMNPQQNPLGRPPSYTYAPPGGLAPGQQQQGRPHSPLPPINTAGAPHGYPPQQMYQQQPQGPPGYPPQQQQQPQGGYGGGYGAPPPAAAPAAPQGPQSYTRPGGAVEVEAAGRSKAQLIVGIDFVSSVHAEWANLY